MSSWLICAMQPTSPCRVHARSIPRMHTSLVEAFLHASEGSLADNGRGRSFAVRLLLPSLFPQIVMGTRCTVQPAVELIQVRARR
eukprot:6211049-Pleurochrysis_carterae.AAC.7